MFSAKKEKPKKYVIVEWNEFLFIGEEETRIEKEERKIADELTQSSLSCNQFKLSREEMERLAKSEAALRKIDDTINEIVRQQELEEKIIAEVRYCTDVVLCEILNKKIPAFEGRITCRIDRKYYECEVRINKTEAKKEVIEFFELFMKKNELKVETKIANEESYVKVTFDLVHRDKIISANKLIDAVTTIPVSTREFKGC